jgi:chromosome segregation ATPase
MQNLKYDNSLMAQEIVNLNKELNQAKQEIKQLNEYYSKFTKENAELKQKIGAKTESYNKIKKDNDELVLLIQSNSNHKSYMALEVPHTRSHLKE